MHPTPARADAGARCWAAVSGIAGAQVQQVYRYVDIDGKVVYSDKPPPANAKDAQAKRVTRATASKPATLSFATQQAQERFPVTLYTFCLRRRVRHRARAAEQARRARTRSSTSARATAPTSSRSCRAASTPRRSRLASSMPSGFNEAKWQAMLTDAGYPKTPAAANHARRQACGGNARRAPDPDRTARGRAPQGRRLPAVASAEARLLKPDRCLSASLAGSCAAAGGHLRELAVSRIMLGT